MARRDKVARGAEITGGVTAGTVGTILGAGKLRDAYRRDYPAKFAQHAQAAERTLPKVAAVPKVLHAETGAHFIPLALGTSGALVATGANKYRKHRTKTAALIKSLQARKDETLDAIGEVGDTTRKLKSKVVPSGLKAAQIAADKTRQAIAQENARLQKAYDPDRRVQRRERAAEVGLGAASAGTAGAAVRSGRLARRLSAEASTAASHRDRNFQRARENFQSVRPEVRRHAASMKYTHGKGVSSQALSTIADHAGAGERQLVSGLVEHTHALHNAQAATGAIRRARHLGVGAAGLAGGAYVAHRRASGHNR